MLRFSVYGNCNIYTSCFEGGGIMELLLVGTEINEELNESVNEIGHCGSGAQD